jgi:hypothetical protein
VLGGGDDESGWVGRWHAGPDGGVNHEHVVCAVDLSVCVDN